MKPKVQIIKGNKISDEQLAFINKQRAKEFGKDIIQFTKGEHKDTLFFFLTAKKEILAFGLLRDIKIKYLNKKYQIGGIAGVISIKKKKGFGRILVEAQIKYSKKKGKTILGFCGRKVLPFYEKVGLRTKKDFIKRFVYKNPRTGKEIVDDDGYGVYYEGKDRFISKVLSTKSVVYIPILHW